MRGQAPKFYQLSALEKEAGQIKDIYKMINQQEQTMEDLLSKYNMDEHKQDSYRERQSKTIDITSSRKSQSFV